MVPTDYRLDHVVARLIERLEGQRPTYSARPEDALAAYQKTAEAQVEAAIGEMTELGWTDDPERHAAFLRQEVLETFLPRYHRIAQKMSGDEAGGYGFGAAAEPFGRLALVVVALAFGWLVLLKMIALPIVWPLILLTVSLPFWPDIAGTLFRRRYRTKLLAIVDDMTRIQDQENAYLSPESLRVDEESPRPRPRQRETE